MNSTVLRTVRLFQDHYLAGKTGRVLDVGSMNVGCRWSGRDLWSPPLGPSGWKYTGCDIEAGNNVDLVIDSEQFSTGLLYEVVMSDGCLEHCERPWLVFASMARHVSRGGYLYSLIPWIFPYHCYPIDGWRISPDGWRVLCRDNGLQCLEAKLVPNHPWREKTLIGLAFNLWVRWFHGCRSVESVVVAQKPL